MLKMKKKMKSMTIKKLVIILIVLFVVSFVVFFFYSYQTKRNMKVVVKEDIQTITLSELSMYDGSDPTKPIYLGLNGYVYDVSEGRKFYETNGTYHYLAGKDSSEELNLIGGDIIVRKYKVIAKLGK